MYLEGGKGNGGGGDEPRFFRMRIMGDCFKCHRTEDQDVIKRGWLEPHFVRQGDNGFIQTQLCPSCAKWHLRYWIKARFKLRIGRFSSILAPGYGECSKCHTNWHFCERHSTDIPDTGRGMFVLCEQCWPELTPEQRLPHYKAAFDAYPDRGFSWDQLKAAVLADTGRNRTP